MKKIQNTKKSRAGGLIILLLFPLFTQSFHCSYEALCCFGDDSTSTDNRALHHHYDDCLVCQFHFTSYTATEFPECDLTHSSPPNISVPYTAKEYQTSFFSYFLRAPPLNSQLTTSITS